MASQLVATKLYVPKVRQGIVARERLRARMRRGTQSKLTLISAPAGFGKTTLLAEWLGTADPGRGVAWLSLDQTDNEVTAFWTHLVAALQKAAASIGGDFPALQATELPPDDFLAEVVNALGALPQDIDLVLDDYHVINQAEIETGLSYLLEHLPPQVHIVISTRADPALPLARLRARGELVEVRSADLRFTAEEAATYLNEAMGLDLSVDDIAVLGERTEGWIAALQLAVLSLEGRDDAAGFIAGFAGSDRYIVDYLVEEVLQRVPEDVRRFLFRTCFLARMNGALCDAVIGANGSKAMLEALDRQNLFVVPLDDRRQWYRYHHLFADVLLAHLTDDMRDELPALHRRASVWYEAQGERLEAIRHAFAGNDFASAADLVERAIPLMQKNRGEATIREWSRKLPAELVRNRPVLGIGFVGALVSYGDFDGIEDRLLDVERALARFAEPGPSPHPVVVVDTNQLPRLPGAVELYRAAMAQVRGDVPAIITHAQRVLELAPADDHVGRAAGSSMLGIAYWSLGQLEPARQAWTLGSNGLQRAGHIADVLGVSIALADINRAQGRLREAIQICERALHLANAESTELRGTADMHAGLSALYREQNNVSAAHLHLSKSQELGERAGLPQYPYRWRVAAAQLRLDEGDRAQALTLLDEAERVYVSDFFPNVRPIAAIRARVWIAEGQLGDARRWQRETGVGSGDELSYLREFEHLTLARLLLAQSTGGAEASALLQRLLDAAIAGGRNASVIEISVLQALAAQSSDVAAALVPLERALTLAEPEGYLRLFLVGGERMTTLLKLALKRGIAPDLVRKILGASGPSAPKAVAHPDLIEPLSDRELDVLRLLRSDMGGPEIARELMISLNTMRTHTKNIYEKLGVNNRRAAVHRADELHLSGRSQTR